MKHLFQAALVFFICLAGEAFVKVFSLSFPSSVISMVLLFLLLLCRWIKRESIQEFIRFLQQNMALFFVPAGVAIMENYAYVKGSVLPLLLICVISTVVTFAATAYTVSFVSSWQQRREERAGLQEKSKDGKKGSDQ